MNSNRIGCFLLAAFVTTAASTLATPPGDDCTLACGDLMPTLTYGARAFSTVGATSSAPTDISCSSGNGYHIYNDVWFSFVPACTGVTTITSCGSSFDTILAVYSGCPYHTAFQGQNLFCIYDNNLAIACNDDFGGCGVQSALTFYVIAGTTYAVRVGAYVPGVTGSGTLTVTGPACTYPRATIATPEPLSCNCLPITITGEADADPGTFSGYTVEARAIGSIPWTLVASSLTPVPATGTLATWNTVSLAEGYYELRLSVLDTFGQRAQDEETIYINRDYDTVSVRTPHDYNLATGDGIYGGEVCIDGTVYDGCGLNYRVEYASLSTGPYNPVNPGFPTNPGTIINDPIGSNWSTRTGPTAVADGVWFVRVTGLDNCGDIATQTRRILVDNTPPVAQIESPSPCSYITGLFPIRGTIDDANIGSWVLQYTGGPSSGWTTIGTGTANMPPGSVLANWNTGGLPLCAYTVRLIASDKAVVSCLSSNSTEFDVSIDLGCKADINRSGAVTVQDLFDFLAAYFGSCP